MNTHTVNPSLLAQVIEHIVHDKLPIAPIGKIYIAPVGSKAIEGMKEISTFTDKEHGEFVFVGNKK